jgi:cob(I)alamin adenosyltransferase
MERGLIHIYTGDGKGKTTAAMGLALRAAGHKKKVYILQFLKARSTGEVSILKELPYITFVRANTSPKFVFEMNEAEREQLQLETDLAWSRLVKVTGDTEYELVILDEIMGAIDNHLLSLKQVIELVNEKSPGLELVLTGRNASPELVKLADYVTEMKMIKHPYQENIPARKGIEF